MDKNKIFDIIVKVLAYGLGALLIIAGIAIVIFAAIHSTPGFLHPPYMLFFASLAMEIIGGAIYVTDQILKHKLKMKQLELGEPVTEKKEGGETNA